MSKPSREIEVPKIASQSGDPGLYEVLRDIVKRTSAYVNDLIDTHRHGTDDIDDLTAASVANVPAGSISSTNVQDALNELDSEKITTDGTARTIVKKAGTVVGTRRGINLIEGTNVTLTVADDSGNEEVDVTIASSAGGVGGSGTSGKLPKWTGSATLGDSIITENSGKIGVNVTSPDGVFHVLNTSGSTGVFEGVATIPTFVFERSNGTPGSKTAVALNDWMGGIWNLGYNGTSYNAGSGSYIATLATQNWTSGSNGCEILMGTTRNGTATVSEVLRLTNDRRVRVKAAVDICVGSGSPEGAITAVVGSMYLRTDGGSRTTLYVKESGTGNTGWAAK